MSAITAALSQIDRVASDGDLTPGPAATLQLAAAADPILLPDGRRIYPAVSALRPRRRARPGAA
jgi:hypothetical protein